MRRHLPVFVALLALLGTISLQAQDPVARARQQEVEEQQRRLNARLMALEEALQSIQQEMNTLRAEVRQVREQASRANNNDVQSSVRQLEEKIREVDRNRLKDQEAVLSVLKSIQRTASTTPRPTPTPAPPGKSYEYTIREGDTISAIVNSLKEQGLNLSVDSVLKANPKLDPKRLRPGSTIIIPVPES